MWPWVLLFAVIAVAGLVLVGALAWRLYGKVRRLGNTVADASLRLAAASDALEGASARSSGRERQGVRVSRHN